MKQLYSFGLMLVALCVLAVVFAVQALSGAPPGMGHESFANVPSVLAFGVIAAVIASLTAGQVHQLLRAAPHGRLRTLFMPALIAFATSSYLVGFAGTMAFGIFVAAGVLVSQYVTTRSPAGA
jgi:hypothetical protein